MRIAWWMYNNTGDSEFTMNSPRNFRCIARTLDERNHQITLPHVPRPPAYKGVRLADWKDTGPYSQAWDPYGLEVRRVIQDIVRANSGQDPQNRSQKALVDWIQSSAWRPLEADVQYVELYPCVSLLAKLELAHAVLRGVLSGVPTVLVDQDFGADCVLSTIDDMHRMAGWDVRQFYGLFSLWSPHVTRIWNGFQSVALPCYDLDAERPLDKSDEVDYVFGYIGNDYHREGKLAEFYKEKHDSGVTVENAVWGRWRLDRYPGLTTIVPERFFKGPVSPNQIHDTYRKCAASVVIAHKRFYACKLVAFRWMEVIEAGRLLFADAELRSELDMPAVYVNTPESARKYLDDIIATDDYWGEVQRLRNAYRKDPRFSPIWVVNRLEALANGHRDKVDWIEPEQSRRELLTVR